MRRAAQRRHFPAQKIYQQSLPSTAPGVRAGVRRRLQGVPDTGSKALAFRYCAFPMPNSSALKMGGAVATVILMKQDRWAWPSLALDATGKGVLLPNSCRRLVQARRRDAIDESQSNLTAKALPSFKFIVKASAALRNASSHLLPRPTPAMQGRLGRAHLTCASTVSAHFHVPRDSDRVLLPQLA